MRIRASEIAERLATQAEQVAGMLLPAGKRAGKFWQAGDVAGSEGESLKVYLAGPKAGRWQDYATGEHGDLLDLWAATQSKSLTEAMHDAADWLGLAPDPVRQPVKSYAAPKPSLTNLKSEHLNWLGSRMLEQEHIDRFGVKSEGDWIAFPYLDSAGKVFAVKYRTRDKKMRSASDCRPGLYGWQAMPEKARSVALVEGELDAIALAHYGMPTLSVPNGGGGKGKQDHWIQEEFDNLNRFDTIFLCLDQDEPGQEAAAEIMERLGADRCRMVSLPHKDANECLQHGVTKEQMREIFRKAKCIDPDELRRPTDYLTELYDEFHGQADEDRGFGPPFPQIARELRFREGELVIVAGPNGSGKSQYCGHQMLEAIRDDYRVCIASMEFKPRRYLARLLRQCGAQRDPSKPYIKHITDWLDDRLWVFDLTGTAKTDRMLEVFRYARRRYGVRVFLIDNLAKCGFAEDDYNAQKQFVDTLGDFAKEHDAVVFLVHHMRKGGEGKDGIKGTSAITDMADTAITIWRNHDKENEIRTAEIESRDPDPEMVKKPDALITCVKQRNGECEPKKAAWFDVDTFQFLSAPQAKPFRYCPDFSVRAVAGGAS